MRRRGGIRQAANCQVSFLHDKKRAEQKNHSSGRGMCKVLMMQVASQTVNMAVSSFHQIVVGAEILTSEDKSMQDSQWRGLDYHGLCPYRRY